MATTRQRMLDEVADHVLALRLDHPTRVGIDGHSAAGKTTFADELAGALVADGGFLQKPALARHWDLRIYLHIEVGDVLHRGTIRDQAWMDSAEAAAERYRTYYIPGEELYLAEIRPAEKADIVIDNRDFRTPRIIRGLSDQGREDEPGTGRVTPA